MNNLHYLPLTARELKIEILNRFDILVSRNWFRYFLQKYPNKLKIALATPQGEKRHRVSNSLTRMHISNLADFGEGIPTELILKLDEASLSDWEDKRPKIVLVLYSEQKCNIKYADLRNKIKNFNVSCHINGRRCSTSSNSVT